MVAAFLLLTIRPGQRWDGDSELYIMNALNILHGRPYAITDYVVDPLAAIHPKSYPPGLPILMVPVLALFGINYVAIKAMLVLCFLTALVLTTRVAKRTLSTGWVVFLVAALGLNPYLWEFKNTVFSELSFMLFVYLGLFCFDQMDRAAARGEKTRSLWLLAALGGICFGFAYGVRSIGIVLFAAIIGITVVRHRYLRWLGAAAAAWAVGFGELLVHLFPVDNSTYRGELLKGGIRVLVSGIPHRIEEYLATLGSLLVVVQGEHWNPAKTICAVFFLFLLGAGLIRAIRRRITIYEVFFIFYLGFLIVYPVLDEINRFVLPLLPLIFLYALTGAQNAAWHVRRFNLLPACVALALAILYLPPYFLEAKANAPLSSVDDPEAKQIYAQIDEQVPKNDLIMCLKPTVIALYTDRHATNPPSDPASPEFESWVRRSEASWLVDFRQPVVHPGSLVAALSSLQPDLKFENSQFALYRIKPGPFSPTRFDVRSVPPSPGNPTESR